MSPIVLLRRLFQLAPVSCLLVVGGIVVQLAVMIVAGTHPHQAAEAPWWCGAVSTLVVPGEPEMFGPLKLWDGDWWRVFVSPFHHGSLIAAPHGTLAARWHVDKFPHLLLNATAILYLGTLLERRVRRTVFVALVVGALPVAFLPEYLLGHTPVGLSGVAYAMFGMAVVLRRNSAEMEAAMPAGVVRAGLSWLVLGIVLTAVDAIGIANVAHATGLLYGALWGAVVQPVRSTGRRVARIAFGSAHLLVPVALWLVCQPYWIGRYHWYESAKATTWGERRERLERAAEFEPYLEPIWLELAEVNLAVGDHPRGWSTLVEGVARNRDSKTLIDAARDLWPILTPAERTTAREAIRARFADDAVVWSNRLIPETPFPPRIVTVPPGFEAVRHRDLSAPSVDENAPNSALLGERL